MSKLIENESNRPPRIKKLVREEINKSLDTWFQPGCRSREDIIDAFDEKWKMYENQ